MGEYIKKVGNRIAVDIRQYWFVGIAFVIYSAAVNLMFGAFCPMVIFSGFPCPGCGMSRAAFFLLCGRWKDAWQMNPMIFPVAFLAVYFVVNRYLLGRWAKGIKQMAVAVLVLMILSYACRMYLYFPDRIPYVYYEKNMLERLTLGKYPFFM